MRRRLAAPKLIDAFARAYPEPRFIEIGANDGVQHDHLAEMIRTRHWRGLMVEPVPYVFERLRANYGDLGRVELENAAVADGDGTVRFYHLREAEDHESLPDWYDAIGSLSREAVAAHGDHIPDIDERIVQIEVPALTFESLCAKHGIDDFDLLLVDAEGYDREILNQVDLDRWRPRLLVYEHYHLSAEERRECELRVAEHGYQTMAEGFNTWCLHEAPDDELARVWRRVEPAIPALFAQ
jgi:FkbM family methyltransferase